jgi:hypothetical protein
MHVFQTAGVPPSMGKTILANMGCTQKRRVALKKRAKVKIKSNALWSLL